MVKVDSSALKGQNDEVKAYCEKAIEAGNGLINSTQKIDGFKGKTGESINQYLTTTYPALGKAIVLHAEALKNDHQTYVDEYDIQCAGETRDSEKLTEQIQAYDELIKGFENELAGYEQTKQRIKENNIMYLYSNENLINDFLISSMTTKINNNKEKKEELEKKLQELLDFDSESANYFTESAAAEEVLIKGLQALGLGEDGKVGTGSWNGSGFSKIDRSWINTVNNNWIDTHGTEKQKFEKILKEEYGFDDQTIAVIMKLKDKVDEMKISQSEKDYVFNRLLGGLVYGSEGMEDSFKWNSTAGTGLNDHLSIESQLKGLLSPDEYNLLRYKVRIQNQIASSGDEFFWDKIPENKKREYKNTMEQALGKKLTNKEFQKLWEKQYNSMKNKTDYAHQSITTATNLLNHPRGLDAFEGGHENLNNLSGWKGDATLKGNTGKVSLGPDDYRADLDAENIVYLMKKNDLTYSQAVNKYYGEVGIKYTRSELFLQNENFTDVKNQILKDLKITSMAELKEKQPDAYQFIKNLEHKTNELRKF